MGYMCDYCGEQRSMVYCRSDAACLCLSCDRNIHSANALSRRHTRTLVCERCNSEPAFTRCIEESVSLCQNCDWAGHGGSNSVPTHNKQTVNSYSGCPSAEELSSIWSFMSEPESVNDSSCEQKMGSMSIADSYPKNSQGPSRNNYDQDLSVVAEPNDLENVNNSSLWIGTVDSRQQNVDQQARATNSTAPKVSYSGTKGAEQFEDDGFYDDFNMDEVDLSIENYEELFGSGNNDPEHLFAKDGIDSLFGIKAMSGADSNCQGAYMAEKSSTGQANAIQPANSNAASADSMISCKTEPAICYARQHSNLSFSSLTGESCGGTGDYQDCGASSMLLMGEPPWITPCLDGTLPSGSRSDAVQRYKDKKKTRKFDKRVRYATRKARADVRKRVKGRFVKAGEAYDYDPLSETRSY